MPELTQYDEIVGAATSRVLEQGTLHADKIDQLILITAVGQVRAAEQQATTTAAAAATAADVRAIAASLGLVSRSGQNSIIAHVKVVTPWGVFGGMLAWLAQFIINHVGK